MPKRRLSKRKKPPKLRDGENVAMMDYTDEGIKLRDEALANVEVVSFSQAVCDCISEGIAIGKLFTTDDVWAIVTQAHIVTPKEPRAMGAAMIRARKQGLCVPTRDFVPTRRKQAHHSPQRVWQRCG